MADGDGPGRPVLADPASLTAEERRLREEVRSLVGLLPICATTVIEADLLDRYPQIAGQARTFLGRNQDLLVNIADPTVPGPVYGGTKLFQDDPHWRDLILFYEYFHGDNGAGLGASHQTWWTGLVARLIQTLGQLDAATVLEDHRWPLARPYRRLTADPVADISTAREARGVSELKQPD